MEFLYISTLSSERIVNNIYENTGKNPGYSMQKFSRLFVKGVISNNGIIKTLSALPITHKMSKKRIFIKGKEIENGIEYNYIPFINLPFLRNICLFIYSFIYVLFWGIKKIKNRCIICDVLNVSICMGAVCAASILRLRKVAIVTDLPDLMLRGGKKRSLFLRFTDKLNNSYLSYFSHYILLTEQMNDIVNPNKRPHIIIEGIADIEMKNINSSLSNKQYPKIIMYAGGLHERYGLKMLIEAFIRTNNKDWNLYIYGSGPFSEELKEYCLKDNRIFYHGVVPNEEVVKTELCASLLINPRPTNEEFTKYSFPSKNMEYMISGTPVITTRLPGMPKEYYEYIYILDTESVDGYEQKLRELFKIPSEELFNKGQTARQFILKNKTNIIQTKRFIDFINNNR